MNKTLYIIRGLPGSGKSTLGESGLAVKSYSNPNHGGVKYYSYAADDWFTDQEGNYNFVPQELPQAHEDCRARVLGAMLDGAEYITVCNTFTQAWEAEPYVKLCKMHVYTPVVIECQNQFGNIHDCPQEKIDEMTDRWDSREDFMHQLDI
jgi:hypothetical protein